jgi:hypothetical protein
LTKQIIGHDWEPLTEVASFAFMRAAVAVEEGVGRDEEGLDEMSLESIEE